MQVQSTNPSQFGNPAFNAKILIHGVDKANRELSRFQPKYLLPEGSIEKLQAKARFIGTDADIIHVSVLPHIEGNGNRQHFATRISMGNVCPSINSAECSGDYTLIPWNKGKKSLWWTKFTPDKESVYKTISKYIDEVKAKFDNINSIK